MQQDFLGKTEINEPFFCFFPPQGGGFLIRTHCRNILYLQMIGPTFLHARLHKVVEMTHVRNCIHVTIVCILPPFVVVTSNDLMRRNLTQNIESPIRTQALP